MYLDSRGFVTIGMGHLIADMTGARKLEFRTAKSLPASAADIKVDYDSVKKLPPNRPASFYKIHTNLIILNVEIDKLTNQHIVSFEKELRIIYAGFDGFPTEVKLALFDLIFNLGATRLSLRWPTFNAAIKVKDWQKSADNSGRAPPVSAERNKYVKDLLEKGANPAHSQHLKL